MHIIIILILIVIIITPREFSHKRLWWSFPGVWTSYLKSLGLFADYYKVWLWCWDLVIRLYFKILEEFYVLFSKTDVGLWIYYLFVWSNLNFLHIFQWITLPIQLCLVLNSFCVNLLRSLIMLLVVLLLFTPWELFTSTSADGLSLVLSDSKSLQVFMTFLSNLAVPNNVVVWMVSTRPLIFQVLQSV